MYSKAVVPDNPSKRVFGWYDKYYKGSIIDEFNDDGTDNDFRDIQKDLVKEFGLYAETLCVYDMLDTNDFEKLEFENRDDVVSCMTSLNFCISYTDFVEIENLVEVDELISRMLIDLYEKI